MAKEVITNPFWHIRQKLCGHNECRWDHGGNGPWSKKLNTWVWWQLSWRAFWGGEMFESFVRGYDGDTRRAAAKILRHFRSSFWDWKCENRRMYRA